MSSTEIGKKFSKIITVTLNPTIDRIVEVPGLTIGDHQVGRTTTRSCGGKGVNISRVLDAMGTCSTMTGFFGADNLAIFSAAASKNITTEFVVVPGSTRENITIVDTQTHIDTHIRDVGLEVTAADVQKMRELLERCCGAGVIVAFAGSIPPGLSPDDFANLVQLCIDARSSVVVDTSGEALRAVIDKKLWGLKPNTIELQEIVGAKLETLDEQLAAAGKLTTNIENVLFSCGAAGAYWITPTQTLHASLDLGDTPLPVRNTVGCGDTLLGVFLTGIFNGASHDEILAAAVGTASASAAHQVTAAFDPQLAATLKSKTQISSRNS
ncbi:MAG: 1-phosphofructokinase family hexose kinase [Phycisphaerae bacterium]|nr:1-phosphofructokinase family hexose kinase [Phycisphaerae bacterium]